MAELIGGIWYRTLEQQVHSRWDLLTFIAHRRLRHPATEADPEEEDDATIAQQKAEALRMLRS